ncbi:MAG: hypothetical protein IKY10_05125 [Clostridia bacterium]|nr:hypothetical protein [Clostridia bacterium]
MKKIWKYITISLLLTLGLFCVGILYIFFVPGASLFNITYINMNSNKKSNEYLADTVSNIVLNSRAYEIKVYYSEEETIYLKAHANSFGFVHKANNVFDLKQKLDYSTLTFTITEPHGFATSNDSYIELFLPETQTYNLTISNYKAKTTIISPKVKINNLNYTTTKGEFNFSKGEINGNLNLKLNKGDFKISKDVITNENDLTLSITKGSFSARNSTLGDVSITYNERGKINLGACKDIRSNNKSSGGQITATKAQHVSITAGDTILSFNEVTHAVSIDLKKSGRVTIKKLSGVSSINTNSGNINLETTLSPLTAKSDSGNINISDAYSKISLTSNYGNSNVKFSESAPSYKDNSSSRVLYANIKNGTLTASGVEHVGEVNEATDSATGGIKIRGNGRVSLRMDAIYGVNSVAGNDGNLRIVFNKSSSYVLNTQSAGGSVRVNLTQISEYNGYTTKDLRTTYVNCTSSVNSLTATTDDGYLTILDTNFA